MHNYSNRMHKVSLANATPGQSAAPSHVDGGAGYVQYQLTPKISLATCGEYMSDRQDLFSGKPQALKEWTGTYKYSSATASTRSSSTAPIGVTSLTSSHITNARTHNTRRPQRSVWCCGTAQSRVCGDRYFERSMLEHYLTDLIVILPLSTVASTVTFSPAWFFSMSGLETS